MDWRPIDTAPKTGRVLLALPDRTVHEGYWGAAAYDRRQKRYTMAWVTHPNSGDVQPTHWMPLPEPPK